MFSVRVSSEQLWWGGSNYQILNLNQFPEVTKTSPHCPTTSLIKVYCRRTTGGHSAVELSQKLQQKLFPVALIIVVCSLSCALQSDSIYPCPTFIFQKVLLHELLGLASYLLSHSIMQCHATFAKIWWWMLIKLRRWRSVTRES